jgi:hypothetical protein
VKSLYGAHQHRFTTNGLKLLGHLSSGPCSLATGNDNYAKMLFWNHGY